MKIIDFKQGRKKIWINKVSSKAYFYIKRNDDIDIVLTKYGLFPICKKLFECNNFDSYDNYYYVVEKYIDIVLNYIRKRKISVNIDICNKLLKRYHYEKNIYKKHQKVRRCMHG